MRLATAMSLLAAACAGRMSAAPSGIEVPHEVFELEAHRPRVMLCYEVQEADHVEDQEDHGDRPSHPQGSEHSDPPHEDPDDEEDATVGLAP